MQSEFCTDSTGIRMAGLTRINVDLNRIFAYKPHFSFNSLSICYNPQGFIALK